MTSLEKILKEFKEDNILDTLYRIESNQSTQNMQINDRGIIYCQDSNLYTYFSISQRHHDYFSEKRLYDYIKECARKEGLRITKNSFINNESYKKIKNLVIQDDFDKDCSFKSIKMNLPYTFKQVIKNNSLQAHEKCIYEKRIPERSDPRTFSGGYGVCGPWLDLLLNLTFIYESHTLDYKDYLEYLKIKKYLVEIGHTNTKGGQLPFLKKANYRVTINKDIFSPYHKYCIANSLEQIRDEKLLLPQSDLALNFKQETRSIISNYEETREKLLRKLDNRYKSIIP